MNHLDLFSGIGGFSLAGQWIWGEDHHIHCFVETDLFCQKVLKKHWPNTPIHNDIRTYKHDGTKIDLLTGGFPCQPFSVAGKRRGKEDDRYLWPEMLRVIAEVRPTWVIGENVPGIIRMELDKVLSDLEDQGYEIQTLIIPACAVDAPHRRDRVWIVAHVGNAKLNGCFASEIRRSDGEKLVSWGSCKSESKEESKERESEGTSCLRKNVADANRNGAERDQSENRKRGKVEQSGEDVTNAQRIHDDSTRYGTGKDGGQQSGQTKIFRNGCQWLPESGICRVADGVSRRVDRLRSLGNAIVPQIVVPIMEGIKALS